MFKQKSILFASLLAIISNHLYAVGGNGKSKSIHNTRIQTDNIIAIHETRLKEISGAAYFNNGLWVLNDAGNNNNIYRINPLNGEILQTVTITNAYNIDWEELTCSETDLYIGDFGNNFGNRKNLCIYKIPLNIITKETTEVNAEIIHFNYPDQSTFIKAANASDFDCEAMCFYENKIHLFTKNWKTNGSMHYTVDTKEGFYSAHPEEKIKTGFLVAGCYVKDEKLLLIGYSLDEFTVKVTIATFDPANHCRDASTFSVGHLATLGQVESIVMNGNQGWMLSEATDFGFLTLPARIISFELQHPSAD